MPRRIAILERRQELSVAPGAAFAFFAQARNLEAITPPWLGFAIVTPGEIEMGPGALIEYRLTLHRVPLRWLTRIEVWEPPRRFVDVQVRGPFAVWEHTHEFHRRESGTEMRDRVRYRAPLGWLGALAELVLVRRDLARIFDHRRDAIAALIADRDRRRGLESV